MSANEIVTGGDFRPLDHCIPGDILPFSGECRIDDCERDGDIFPFIEPALRLASALLMHEDSLPFFHAMRVAAEREKTAEAEGKQRPAYYEFQAQDRPDQGSQRDPRALPQPAPIRTRLRRQRLHDRASKRHDDEHVYDEV